MNTNIDLDACYRAAEYLIFDGAIMLTTHIGQTSSAIAELLRRRGALDAVLLTAWNPHSHVISATQNAARQAQLESELDAAGIVWLTAEGRSTNMSWREPGVCALALDLAQAQALVRRFEQNAFVHYTADGAVRLVNTHSHDR
jgi:hypothetical protein